MSDTVYKVHHTQAFPICSELTEAKDNQSGHTLTDSGGQEGAAGNRRNLLPRDAGEQGALIRQQLAALFPPDHSPRNETNLPKL